MKRSIYCYYTSVELHQCPHHNHFSFQFSHNFFLIFFFFTFSHFFKYLHFLQHFSIIYLFTSPLPSTLTSLFISPLPFTLPFHLSTTLYLNVTLHLSLHLPFSCPFLFTPSYYKFVTLFHSLHAFSSQKKALSLSLSIFWWIFLFFLHLCFRLINCCVL